MKTIAVIINGISLPYHVIHYAIEKAKADASGIFVLFLTGKHERSKGYIFPSDISTTETRNAEKEAATEDEIMLSDNMDIIQEMIISEKISYQSALKINMSIEEVAKLVANANVIIVDENFDKDTLLCDDKISLKAIKAKLNKPVEMISDKS
jgi:hypothetical protein